MAAKNTRLKSTRRAVQARTSTAIRRAAVIAQFADEIDESLITDADQKFLLFSLDAALRSLEVVQHHYEQVRRSIPTRAKFASERTDSEPASTFAVGDKVRCPYTDQVMVITNALPHRQVAEVAYADHNGGNSKRWLCKFNELYPAA